MSQRKKNPKSKDSSGTPTKIANYSPSRQPMRSPLTASKFNASNVKPNVSYGELQIVLQNIQEIRKKANAQITHLSADNQKLRDELAAIQLDYDDLNNKIHKSRGNKNEFQAKIIEQLKSIQSDKKSLEIQLKQSERTILELQSKNKQLLRDISERNGIIGEQQGRLQEQKNKWIWAFTILAGDPSRSQELIWKVKNQYPEGIWEIFLENSEIIQQLQIKTGRLEVIERELAQMKSASKQSSSLLERSMSEVTNLNFKITQYQQQLSNLKEKNLKFQNQLNANNKDFRIKKGEYEALISTLEYKIVTMNKQKQLDVHDLAEKVVRLEEEKHLKELQILEKQKHEEYEAIISQICQESQDYSRLLQRVRYLQKFKEEYYFNVQKIQFLCKLLD